MTLGLGRIATLVGAAVLASGCSAGSGVSGPDEQSESAPVERVVVGKFDSLKIADGFRVQVERGAKSQVTVSASGIPDGQIEAVVDKNTLELKTTAGSVPTGAQLSAVVIAPALADITATSGAQVILQSGMTLGAPDAIVDLTVDAGFEGEVSANSLEVDLQAGARAQVSGSADNASIVGSEAGVLEGYELTVADAKVSLSSGATAGLRVNDTLSVSLSSGSKLVYEGNPEITKRSIESGATLQSSSR